MNHFVEAYYRIVQFDGDFQAAKTCLNVNEILIAMLEPDTFANSPTICGEYEREYISKIFQSTNTNFTP